MCVRRFVATVLAMVFSLAPAAFAGPRILTYQGSVSDSRGTPVADGTYDVRFSLYDDAVAGTQRWTETQSVEVQGGLYSAILGESTAFGNTFNWSYDLWLEVAIDLDGDGFETEETYAPRRRMTSAAWAMDADLLQGHASGYFQRRVTGTAPAGEFLRGINADGTVVTAADQDTHDWPSITGKPSTFPPDSHNHGWSELTGIPAGFADGTDDDTHDWPSITGKPSAFPPSAHGHNWVELTGVPAGFADGIDNDTRDWSLLTGIPAGFADGVDNDSGGDITGVNAGTGLSGGGSSGDVSLSADTTYVQRRVTGSAPAGEYIRAINADGTVVTAVDQVGTGAITSIVAGSGLAGGGTSGDITLFVQFGDDGTSESAARADHTHPGTDIDSAVATATLALFANQTPWSGLTGVPAGFADGIDNDTKDWGSLTGIPAGFADGVDNVGAGDITAVNAGTGLTGGGAGGDVTLHIDPLYIDGRHWSLTGNAGTTSGTHFLGTTDAAPLEVRTSGVRTLVIAPTTISPNILAGHATNSITAGVYGATISGGGDSSNANRATDIFATIGGGRGNQAGNDKADSIGEFATIGGGYYNTASGSYATVGGGGTNTATGTGTTIGGGGWNKANGVSATVAGGSENTASGLGPAVGGGEQNTASASYAMVAGGWLNRASATYATVGGGRDNASTAPQSTVAGGWSNTAGGVLATVGGGFQNRAGATYATVGGGRANASTAGSATVAGGGLNTASGGNATIGGGASNTASAGGATVGGGSANTAGGGSATVGGGWSNTADGDSATVGGGYINTASGDSATVGGGRVNAAAGSYSTVGGGASNEASDLYATVGGGYGNTSTAPYSIVAGGWSNTAGGDRAAVGGGYQNTASGELATIGGGAQNLASATEATVGGGALNEASAVSATVGGGGGNTASGIYATVGGGVGNASSGTCATVAGGWWNTAGGGYSFAAGRQAKATGDGSFAWADTSSIADFHVINDNRFGVRAGGGVYLYTNGALTAGSYLAAGSGTWASVSDRNQKENVEAVEASEVLEKLAAVPVTTWNYKSEDASIRHMGPMAQDLHAAFGLGDSDKSIATVDADGISLAAIQGMYRILQEKDARITSQDQRIGKLEAEKSAQQQHIAELEARLLVIEARLSGQ